MMAVLVMAHFVGAVALVPVARRFGHRAFLPAALLPAVTFVWAATLVPSLGAGETRTQTVSWVPSLGLELTFRVDGLGALMAMVIGGIGALVFWYAAWYFSGSSSARTVAPLLLAFAGAMLGLVLADNVLLLFVFWELTSVTSFLLIGTDDEKAGARAAAQQALLITGAGGLALLAGLVLVSQAAGTWSLSAIVAAPPTGTAATAGAILALVGALTKSAQVPFNSWLPGAMSAPTPVSAYLHSATMVKAGVYLIARLSPAFVVLDGWRALAVAAGLASLVVGGWRALRQHDLKLLLAHGTVSQLGLLVVLFGLGLPAAWFAGLVVLVAHALYKAALFMVVGIVDHATHTRDLRRLDRLGSRLPVLAAAAAVAAASMAGLPPLLGFIGKEEAFAALTEPGVPGAPWVLVVVVAGSVLTVAYSGRFWLGAFGTSPSTEPVTELHPPAPPIVAPAVVLAALSVLLGLIPALAQPAIDAAVRWLGPDAPDETLALWHGVNTALGWSLAVLTVGAVAIAARHRIERLQSRLPRLAGGQRAYDALVRWLLRGSGRLTGIVQNGSLPVYLGVIGLTLVGSVTLPLARALGTPDELVLADSWVQAAVVVIMVVAAVGVALADRRITAVVLVGTVGYGMAGLFVIQGAPDLAVTQLLVETLTVVAFVLVLRHLPDRFSAPVLRGTRLLRAGVGAVVGVVVFAFTLSAVAGRAAPSISAEYVERALPDGGGRNVVNLILVDFRGFDTLGEITVLVTAALGVAVLVRAGRRSPEHDTVRDGDVVREEVAS